MISYSPVSRVRLRVARLASLAALAGLLLAPAAHAAQFTLTWADNSTNETGFKIERATGSTGAFAEVATAAANTTRFVDQDLPAATTFRYRVRAYNAAGNSSYSNIASGTTPASANTAPTISSIAAQTIPEDGATSAIAFTIGDAQTSAGSLTLTGSSSNTTLVPSSGITFAGSGANRTVTVRPAANRSGSATVTVRVSDGSLSASAAFAVTVSAVNDAPTISNITDRSVAGGTSSGAIAFTIGDVETSAASLTVSASSSNQTLVPSSAIVLGGSGSSRTITVTPRTTTTGGSASITVRVSDGALTTSDTFIVTVPASTAPTTNTAPTITSIANQQITTNASTDTLAFTIGDAQTAAGSLTLITNSSNKTLVPTSNITLGGSGANRTITVRPVSNSTGWSTIWVKVSDGSLSKTISFMVNVSAGLTFQDIGSPALSGSESLSGSTITINAGGTDIWRASDQFRFGHQALTGDTELTVRLASLTRSDGWAKAGLMYRSSTAANAAYVFVCLTPSNGVALQYRSANGAAAQQKHVEAGSLPRWLKLTRSGDTFYAFHSVDGTTWDLVDFVTVDLPDTARAGLAVTAHTASTRTTAKFENLSVD